MKEMLISSTHIYPSNDYKNVIEWIKNHHIYVFHAEMVFSSYWRHRKKRNRSDSRAIDYLFSAIPEFTDDGTFVSDEICKYMFDNWDDIMN